MNFIGYEPLVTGKEPAVVKALRSIEKPPAQKVLICESKGGPKRKPEAEALERPAPEDRIRRIEVPPGLVRGALK